MENSTPLNINARVPNDLKFSFTVPLKNKNIKPITSIFEDCSDAFKAFCSKAPELKFEFIYGYGGFFWARLINTGNDKVYTLSNGSLSENLRWFDIIELVYLFYKINGSDLSLWFQIKNSKKILPKVPNHYLEYTDIDCWFASFDKEFCEIYSYRHIKHAKIRWKDGIKLLIEVWKLESAKIAS